MKYIVIIILSFLFFNSFATSQKSKDSLNSKKIEALTEELKDTKKELYDRTIVSYQQTNDRLNNYITFTGVIATIFGVIIGFGSIWVGIESLKSSRKRDEAIKILEEAKKYVEEKKSEFEVAMRQKLEDIEIDYKKIIDINKQRLIADIDNQAANFKELTERKKIEIEGFSIEEKNDKAIESLQKRIELFESIGMPDDPKILLSKAKLLREKVMPNEAIELLTKVIEKEPENWDAFWELGWCYAKIGEKEKAVENYRQSISLKDNAHSHNNIGVILKASPYDALMEFEKAMQLDPTNKVFASNKALTLIQLNSIQPAIETYKSIIELDKSDLTSYSKLIQLLKKKGKNDEAIECYDQAILNIPDKSTELNYSKALFLNDIGKKIEAFTILQNLINLNYQIEECLQRMAQIKIDLNEMNEASKLVTSINELNIKNPFAYILRAQILVPQDPNLAMSVIKEGVKHVDVINSKLGYGYFLIAARIFAKNKLKDMANELYSQAIDLIAKKMPSHKEGDILTAYETYIFLDEYGSARELLNDNNQYIVAPKYKIIKTFLMICLEVIGNENVNINDQVENIKYLKGESNEKTSWSFEEMEFYLESKLDAIQIKKLKFIIKYIKDEISYEELVSNLSQC